MTYKKDAPRSIPQNEPLTAINIHSNYSWNIAI
jgi:hypothetical protein